MARVKRAMFHFKPFSLKQKKILTWWLPDSPVSDQDGIIADGAIRSGKTVSMALSFIMWAMDSFEAQNFGMCGKTIGSFRRNVLTVLKLMLWSRGYKLKDHRADNLLEVTFKGCTNYFYIFGGKDESSQDLIQGITLAGVFFDEVALMPESFVNQATGRCSVDGSKFWFNCNPDGPFHWFKVNWIDRSTGYLSEEQVNARRNEGERLKNILYLHFTMADNLSLTDEIKERYRSMYRGVFYERYILGMWKIAEGIIFDMFDKSKHILKSDTIVIAHGSKKYVSIDYGTQNPTVFLMWEQTESNRWYCSKEYYYGGREKAKQKTDTEFSVDLKEWIGETRVDSVIVDPSAASFIAQLKKDGFRVKKADNDVLNGIRLVSALLNTGALIFNELCTNTIKEFSMYSWDNKAARRGEDKPIKEYDHAMDAVRYFCMTILKIKCAVEVLKPKGAK